jgi:hypothetical protein
MDYMQQADQGVVQVYPCPTPSKLQTYNPSAPSVRKEPISTYDALSTCIYIDFSCSWCGVQACTGLPGASTTQ